MPALEDGLEMLVGLTDGAIHEGNAVAVLQAGHEVLRQRVVHKLLIDWSPQQISGWLKVAYPDDETMRVSHETIYRSLVLRGGGRLPNEGGPTNCSTRAKTHAREQWRWASN
ncbi:IS30 family transposase [Povalibacter uvarum]|uniref:IS30 family transposase n=1 Tax=Povalibacter uvarum TaxID=732238 RepID=A0A841HJA5_9GAMM|nr:hypothetical protein [Povalibacter uvarum]MBB6092390.1 IS30 family transposase [Povalibacter uvarum]